MTTLGKLGQLLRDTATVARTYPHLMIPLLSPFGFIPEVRRWVADKIAEEEAETKLRAVVSPEHLDAVFQWVDETLEELTEAYADSHFSAPERTQILKAAYGYYITTGEVPK